MMQSMRAFATNPIKSYKFMQDNFPQIKHRRMELEVSELKESTKNPVLKARKLNAKYGLMGLEAMDSIAVNVGTYAVYLENVGKGHKYAIEKARNSFTRTQPQSGAGHLPVAYTTNELVNLGLQFTNQLNQNYNMMTHSVPMYIKNKQYKQAMYGASAVALAGAWIWMINNKRMMTKDDIIPAAAETVAINTPIVGKSLVQAAKGYDTGIDLFSTVKGFGQFASKDEKTIGDLSLTILDAAAEASGFPGVAVKRANKFINPDKKKITGKLKGGGLKGGLKGGGLR
jgi:hypothetical protein